MLHSFPSFQLLIERGPLSCLLNFLRPHLMETFTPPLESLEPLLAQRRDIVGFQAVADESSSAPVDLQCLGRFCMVADGRGEWSGERRQPAVPPLKV